MTTNEALDNYLSHLRRPELIAKSRDIRETLGITRAVLSNWRRGRTPLRQVYFDKIIETVGVDLNSLVGK